MRLFSLRPFSLLASPCLGCGQTLYFRAWEPMAPLAPQTMRALGYAPNTPSPCRRCPHCLCPKGWRRPVPAHAGGPRQIVRIYRSQATHPDTLKACQRGSEALARAGWQVAERRSSGMRVVNFRVVPATILVIYEQK